MDFFCQRTEKFTTETKSYNSQMMSASPSPWAVALVPREGHTNRRGGVHDVPSITLRRYVNTLAAPGALLIESRRKKKNH